MLYDIKFFLPQNIKGKYLFGKKEEECSEKSVSFINVTIVTASDNDDKKQGDLQFLGTLEDKDMKGPIRRKGFNLVTDANNKLANVQLDGQELPKDYRIHLFYYDKEKFQRTYDEFESDPSRARGHFALSIAKCLKEANEQNVGDLAVNKVSRSSHNLLIDFAGKASKVLNLFSPIFENTAIYRHCCNWKKCLNEEHSRNGFVMLDVMLGILFFLFMFHVQDSGRYFMYLTEIIVGKLRGLLEMLDGAPVGLKLNVQLNNFLLSCFMYHVDLWFNFIVIVEPAIHYLFVPITIFGFFGLSFQCALICDIITLITLHAHCFYIYAAMLYKLELSSIRSLLRIVLGRRLNVLKNRVESQQYTNRQLFLATLFFTTLLFIFPTVIIYYLVFASLRFFVYCTSYILMMMQHKILTFPFYKYLRWITGSYVDATNVSIDFISSIDQDNRCNLTVFRLVLNSSLPWRKSVFAVKTNSQLPKPMSMGTFAKSLLKGELMAFLPNI